MCKASSHIFNFQVSLARSPSLSSKRLAFLKVHEKIEKKTLDEDCRQIANPCHGKTWIHLGFTCWWKQLPNWNTSGMRKNRGFQLILLLTLLWKYMLQFLATLQYHGQRVFVWKQTRSPQLVPFMKPDLWKKKICWNWNYSWWFQPIWNRSVNLDPFPK